MIRIAAITIDAAGTLLHPAEPVPEVYARIGARHGSPRSAAEIGQRLRRAMNDARPLRHGDPTWRAYWSKVVHDTTDIDASAVVDDLVAHYTFASAWRVADGAALALARLRAHGLRLAVLSNWDTGLSRLLERLELASSFDALVVSGECGHEKPSPLIFEEAARRLGVPLAAIAHVGDDPEDDHRGAARAGATAWDIATLGGFAGLLARCGA